MNHFAKRRRLGGSLLVAACLASWLVLRVVDYSLRSTQFWSGWALLTVVIALALFNARKKLPFLPLGNATTWMEFHAYLGFFSIFLFVSHVGLNALHGVLDWSLALLFVAVAGSGLVGILLTRLLPFRLSARGEAVLFERIPALRVQLHQEVEDLVIRAAHEVQTTTIAEFYSARLADFFRKPRNLVAHWLDSEGRFRVLERELWALDRYSNDAEREILAEIHQRMVEKEDLDYRWAQGVALKGWLFFHVPMTYAFLLFVASHVLLAYGFDGGVG